MGDSRERERERERETSKSSSEDEKNRIMDEKNERHYSYSLLLLYDSLYSTVVPVHIPVVVTIQSIYYCD